MELFDAVKILFEKPDEWAKMKPYEKAKFFFMINRFMAIAYPETANALNHLKVSQADVLDYWQKSMRKIYTRTPDWIYTKTKKKEKKKKEMPTEESIRYYLDRCQMSARDLKDAMTIFGDKKTLEPIYKIDKLAAD